MQVGRVIVDAYGYGATGIAIAVQDGGSHRHTIRGRLVLGVSLTPYRFQFRSQFMDFISASILSRQKAFACLRCRKRDKRLAPRALRPMRASHSSAIGYCD